MAFTLTRVNDSLSNNEGKFKTSIYDVTITGSYTAGGYSIAARDVGLSWFRAVQVAGGDVSQGTYTPIFDFGSAYTASAGSLPSAGKLRLFTATATEATGALSPAVHLRLKVIGG